MTDKLAVKNTFLDSSCANVASRPKRQGPRDYTNVSTLDKEHTAARVQACPLDPRDQAMSITSSLTAVLPPQQEDVYPSPGALKAFESTQAHQIDHHVLSLSTEPESKQSAAFPSLKKLVRFGGVTLREFIALTTITEKLTQSPKMYGSLGAFVILTCVVVVFMVWVTGPRHRRNECGSAECQGAHAYLEFYMDKAIDPCIDFYRHVCRRWRLENVNGATLAERSAQDLTRSLHMTLLERARRHAETSQAESLLVNFYDSCRQFLTTSQNIHERLLLDVNQSDINILRLPNTTAALRQVVLMSLNRGISTIFSVSVVLHGDVDLGLYISTGKALAEKITDPRDNSTLTNFIVEALDATSKIDDSVNRSMIKSKTEELLAFEREMPTGDESLPLAETIKASRFAVLMHETDPGDWFKFINSLMRGNLSLREDSPVMSHRLDVVMATIAYLEANHRIGLIYIFLHLLAEVGRFYYKNAFSTEAGVLCLVASQQVVGPSWLDIFSNLTQALLPTPQRAGNIFSSVRRLSSQKLVVYAMERTDAMNALATLKRITMLLDYNVLHSESTFNDSTVHYLNISNRFTYYYASLKAFEATRRLKEPPSLAEILMGESFLTAESTYSGLLNAIVVPPALRQPPLMYSTRVPPEYDMGTIGVLLAKEMFQAGLPSPGKRNTWYEENVEKFVECVQRALMSNDSLPFREGFELFSWARAVKVAHTVTMLMYSSNKANEDFEEDQTAVQQTFFRRYCLMTCSATDNGLDSRMRCLVAILSMTEFARAFKCNSSQESSFKHCANFLD